MKVEIKEKARLNDQTAETIGQDIKTVEEDIYTANSVPTRLGLLARVGDPPGKKEPESHINRKHLFRAQVGGEDVVVLHFSGEEYGEDSDYFRRVFENSVGFYGGQMTRFTDQKLAPTLYGSDNQTMTLVMEKGVASLDEYFEIGNEVEVKDVVCRYIELVQDIWRRSKDTKIGWPRHFISLIRPQYECLVGRDPVEHIENGSEVATLYKQAMVKVADFVVELEKEKLETGFGFEDGKPHNTVLTRAGEMVFIDVTWPSRDYHWAAVLGCFYQSALADAPRSVFTKVLREELKQILLQDQTELAVQLFCAGRMNRLAIPCNARNIVFMRQINLPISAKKIRPNLESIDRLCGVREIDEAIR